MKQNKRFWLVAVALMLATLLVSGLALAEGYWQVDKILIEKDAYTFYRGTNADGNEAVFDEKGNEIKLLNLANDETAAIYFGYHLNTEDSSKQKYDAGYEFEVTTDAKKDFEILDNSVLHATKAGTYNVTVNAFQMPKEKKDGKYIVAASKTIKVTFVDVVIDKVTVLTGSTLNVYGNGKGLYNDKGAGRSEKFTLAPPKPLDKDEKETCDVRFVLTTNLAHKDAKGVVDTYIAPLNTPNWYFKSSNEDVVKSGYASYEKGVGTIAFTATKAAGTATLAIQTDKDEKAEGFYKLDNAITFTATGISITGIIPGDALASQTYYLDGGFTKISAVGKDGPIVVDPEFEFKPTLAQVKDGKISNLNAYTTSLKIVDDKGNLTGYVDVADADKLFWISSSDGDLMEVSGNEKGVPNTTATYVNENEVAGTALITLWAVDAKGNAIKDAKAEYSMNFEIVKEKEIKLTDTFEGPYALEVGETIGFVDGDKGLGLYAIKNSKYQKIINFEMTSEVKDIMPTYGVDDLVWSLASDDDAAYATVTKEGNIYGLKAKDGTVTIKVAAKGNEKATATIDIKVVNPEDNIKEDEVPKFNQKKYYFVNGEAREYGFDLDKDGELIFTNFKELDNYVVGDKYILSIDNTKIAKITVTEYGTYIVEPKKVTGDTPATLSIISTATGEAVATAELYVIDHPIKKIVIAPTEITLEKGSAVVIGYVPGADDDGINFTVSPTANDDEIEWSVNDVMKAALYDTWKYGAIVQLLDAKAGDKVIVTAKAKSSGVTATFTINVIENPIISASFKQDAITLKTSQGFWMVLTNREDNIWSYVVEPDWDDGRDYRWVSFDLGTLLDVKYEYEDEYPDDWAFFKSYNNEIVSVDPELGYVNIQEDAKDGDTAVIGVFAESNPTKELAKITITIAEDNALKEIKVLQDTLTMKVMGVDPNGDVYNQVDLKNLIAVDPVGYPEDKLVWTSDNIKVVDVFNGVAYGYEAGKAIITVKPKNAKDDKNTKTITITVIDEGIKELKFNQDKISYKLDEFEHYELPDTLATTPEYPSEGVLWTSSNPDVLTIDKYTGVIELHQNGVATVTAYAETDETIKASIEVTVTDKVATAVKFLADEIKVNVLESKELAKYVQLEPVNTSYEVDAVKFSSSDPEIAQIVTDKETKVKSVRGRKEGEATITAALELKDGKVLKGTVKVIVKDGTISALNFKKTEYTVETYEPIAIGYTYEPATATPVLGAKFNVPSVSATELESEDGVIESKYLMVDTTSEGLIRIVGFVPGTYKVKVYSLVNKDIAKTLTITVTAQKIESLKFKKEYIELYTATVRTDGSDLTSEELSKNFEKYFKMNLGYDLTKLLVVGPSDANIDDAVIWETTNPEVAYLSDLVDGVGSGYVIPLNPGVATVTAKYSDGENEYKASIKVKVFNTSSAEIELDVDSTYIMMVKGEDNTLKLTATSVDTGDEVPVKWSSNNKSVATVDKKGVVTPKRAGTVTITATTKDGNAYTAKCDIKVYQKKITAVKGKTKITMNVGEERTLDIEILPKHAYDQRLKFSSSNKKVVEVEKDGTMIAKAAGKATVTVSSRDGSKKSLKINVKVKAPKTTKTVTETVTETVEEIKD